MKSARLTFFVIIVLITSLNVLRSQKCDVIKDPITGERLVTVNLEDKWIYLESKNSKTKFEILFEYTKGGALNTVLPAGTAIMFKLENDEVISIKTSADCHPKVAAGTYVYTKYIFEFYLDQNILEKFANSKVTLIRFPDLKAGNFDLDDKGFYGKKCLKALKKGSAYILENS